MRKNEKKYSVHSARTLLESTRNMLSQNDTCYENVHAAREDVRGAVEHLEKVLHEDSTPPGAAIIIRSAHESAYRTLEVLECTEEVLRMEYENRKRKRDGRGAQKELEKIAKTARKESEIALRYLASAQKNRLSVVEQRNDTDPLTALALAVALPVALAILTVWSFMDRPKVNRKRM